MGKIVNIVMYENINRNICKTLIIGTVSESSGYSLILAFKNYVSSLEWPMFQFVGRISATVLGENTFHLDAMTLFSKYLIFSTTNMLYVTNVEQFIESPDYFSPIQIKSIELDTLITNYSQSLYKHTSEISDILVLDHCAFYVSVFIHTKYYGTIMLEVVKDAFMYDEWKDSPTTIDSPLGPKQHLIYGTILNNEDDPTDPDPLPIINSGRLLYNVYTYDYDNAITVLDQRVMGMLIYRDVDNVYNYYILRIINLATHEKSMVYKDFYLFDVNQCVSLILEESFAGSNSVVFTLLCDASIYRYYVTLTEIITVNVQHSYWEDPNNYLIINVTQWNGFTSMTSFAEMKFRVEVTDFGLVQSSVLWGSLTLLFVFIGSLIVVKLWLTEEDKK